MTLNPPDEPTLADLILRHGCMGGKLAAQLDAGVWVLDTKEVQEYFNLGDAIKPRLAELME